MALTLIVILSFIFRILFMSPWLEDWDSVQFAFGIHDFDIAKHQPHAPGYPIYILLAKFLYFATRSDILSLNLLSVLSGSFSIILIFLIAKKMFDKRIGYYSAIIFSIIPISILLSVTPLTNMPGLCSFLVFVYFLYVKRNLFIASFLGGLILGVRFTELPVIVSLLALTILKNAGSHRARIIFSSGIFFFLGLSLWLIPTITVTGLNKFIDSYRWIGKYVLTHDVGINNRPERLLYLIKISFTPLLLAITSISLILIFIKRKGWKIFKYQFLFVWLISYLVPLFFVYNLEVTRYTLPLLPPIAAMAASIVSKLPKITFLLLAVSIFSVSYSQVTRFKNTVPPTIAAFNYVKENYNEDQTIILVSYTFRQFQYYLPNFRSYYDVPLSTQEIGDAKYIIIDYKGLSEKIPNSFEKNIIKEVNFEGDPDIFTRLPKVSLFVIKAK